MKLSGLGDAATWPVAEVACRVSFTIIKRRDVSSIHSLSHSLLSNTVQYSTVRYYIQ